MVELFQYPENITYFDKAERGEDVDWQKLFEGYNSAVDYPVARYYRPIIAQYPNAKIIHTIRDPKVGIKAPPKRFSGRASLQIGRMLSLMIKLPFSSTLRKRFPVLKYNSQPIDNVFGKELKNKQEVIRKYNEINAETLNFIPKERSLVYDVKKGWEPLCSVCQKTI